MFIYIYLYTFFMFLQLINDNVNITSRHDVRIDTYNVFLHK